MLMSSGEASATASSLFTGDEVWAGEDTIDEQGVRTFGGGMLAFADTETKSRSVSYYLPGS